MRILQKKMREQTGYTCSKIYSDFDDEKKLLNYTRH